MIADSYTKERWIRKRSQYQRVYRKGSKEVGRRLIFYVFPCKTEREESRFGITVTAKIGTAVVRNRTKRILREVVRKNLWTWHSGADVVVVARREILEASFPEIEEEFLKLFQRIIKRASLPPLTVR